MKTKCFDLPAEAIAIVQRDDPEVFEEVETANPYAEDVRRRCFGLAVTLGTELEAKLSFDQSS